MPEKPDKDINDNTLFKDFQNGKYYLFEYFFNKYYPGLCVYACRMVQSKSSAEDIVQDFFIRLWEDKNNLVINTSVRSYFLRSVHNRCLNFLNLNNLKKAHHDYQLSHLSQDAILQYPLLDFELESRLQKAIESLPDGIRETFMMNRLEGLTYQEIADKEGVTVKAIEYRMSKALTLLRKDLQDYLPFAWLLYMLR
ncbi:MAG: RNA polymerase sigma-70 factor [Mangrovibacterium sp.]